MLFLIVDLLHGLAEVGLQLVMRIVHLKTHTGDVMKKVLSTTCVHYG